MYKLNLTDDDLRTIAWVGRRYAWSAALCDADLKPGVNEIPEDIAFDVVEGFHEDTQGRHGMFPLLTPDCRLAERLHQFMMEIV